MANIFSDLMNKLSGAVFGDVSTTNVETMTPEQKALFAQLLGSVGGGPSFDPSTLSITGLDAVTQARAQALQGATSVLATTPQEREQRFQSTVAQPLQTEFQRALGQVRGGGTRGGRTFSSDVRRGEQRALEGFGQTLAKARGEFQARTAQENLSASQLLGGLAAQDFNQALSAQTAQAQYIASLLGTKAFEPVVSQQQGAFGSIAGGLIAAYGG